jgi:hypothetical protein
MVKKLTKLVFLTAFQGPHDCPSGVVQKSKGWIAAAVLVPLVVVLVIGGCIAIRSEK